MNIPKSLKKFFDESDRQTLARHLYDGCFTAYLAMINEVRQQIQHGNFSAELINFLDYLVIRLTNEYKFVQNVYGMRFDSIWVQVSISNISSLFFNIRNLLLPDIYAGNTNSYQFLATIGLINNQLHDLIHVLEANQQYVWTYNRMSIASEIDDFVLAKSV